MAMEGAKRAANMMYARKIVTCFLPLKAGLLFLVREVCLSCAGCRAMSLQEPMRA